MVSDAYPTGLPIALERGLIDEALIDEAVRRVLTLKKRLGLLDGALRETDDGRPGSGREAHLELARDAVRRSIVLLQNRENLLPLNAETGRLAVIGPHADDRNELFGPWWAVGRMEDTKTFLRGVTEAMPGWDIVHEAGCGLLEEEPAKFGPALEAAKKADCVLLCLGEAARMSGEAASRTRPDLPACQRKLAEAVLDLGKPVIVVLVTGRPLTIPWLFEKAGAVLLAWFPGSEAGPGLADVLIGKWNPGGKLPVCWPVEVGQMPIFYAQRPTGRPADPHDSFTGRYIDAPVEPYFPFGYGLSYTRFSYSALSISQKTASAGDLIVVEAQICNEGDVEGEETAFLFIRDPVASIARPVLELKGIAKIRLAAGNSGTVRFELTGEDFAFADEDGSMILEDGAIEIMVGPEADPKVLLKDTIQVVTKA